MAKEVIVKGKKYRSLLAVCNDKSINVNGLSYQRIYRRYKKCNGNLDGIFNAKCDLRKKRLLLKGKYYGTIKEICDDESANIYKLGYSTVRSRLDKGQSIETAFGNPFGYRE